MHTVEWEILLGVSFSSQSDPIDSVVVGCEANIVVLSLQHCSLLPGQVTLQTAGWWMGLWPIVIHSLMPQTGRKGTPSRCYHCFSWSAELVDLKLFSVELSMAFRVRLKTGDSLVTFIP